MAGISLLRDGHVETVAFTDQAVRQIDIENFQAIDGDYFGVAGTRKVVKARLGEAATRWPSLADNLDQAGMRSFLSAPLAVDEALAGTLNIYGQGDHGFSELDAWCSSSTPRRSRGCSGARAAWSWPGTR